jgi:hypothetical protein
VLLVDDPDAFKVHDGWPESIPWAGLGSSVARVEDEEYGVAWSRRVWLHPRGEIEFTFARPSWAALWTLSTPARAESLLMIAGFCMIPVEL